MTPIGMQPARCRRTSATRWRPTSNRPEFAARIAASAVALTLAASFASAAGNDNPFGDTRGTDYNGNPYDPGEGIDAEPEPDRLPGMPRFERARFVRFGEDNDGVGYTYYIDPQTLSVQGNEVRYAVLLESGKGAVTSYYEGIDCPDDLYRIYAYGSADGVRFKPVRKPVWRSAREVVATATTGFRKLLINDYLCNPVQPRPVAEIQRRLRRNVEAVR